MDFNKLASEPDIVFTIRWTAFDVVAIEEYTLSRRGVWGFDASPSVRTLVDLLHGFDRDAGTDDARDATDRLWFDLARHVARQPALYNDLGVWARQLGHRDTALRATDEPLRVFKHLDRYVAVYAATAPCRLLLWPASAELLPSEEYPTPASRGRLSPKARWL